MKIIYLLATQSIEIYLPRIIFNHFRSDCHHNKKLKADRPHPRYYAHRPPDYRHTDKVYGLITELLAPNLRVIALDSASRASANTQTDGQTLPFLLSPCFSKVTRLIISLSHPDYKPDLIVISFLIHMVKCSIPMLELLA